MKLIDSTIASNFKKRVLEEVRDGLWPAISLVTGPMVRESVDSACVLDWKFSGISHRHENARGTVMRVVNILDVWYFLDRAYDELSKKDKDRAAKETEPLGKREMSRLRRGQRR